MVREGDFNPERIQVDDGIPGVTSPSVNVGDDVRRATGGVLDYNFGNFELVPRRPPSWPPTAGPRGDQAQSADELSVATFNVENLDAERPADEVRRARRPIVDQPAGARHRRPRGDPGQQRPHERRGRRPPTQTLHKLIDSDRRAPAARLQYRQIDPADDRTAASPAATSASASCSAPTAAWRSSTGRAGTPRRPTPWSTSDGSRNCRSAPAASTRPTPPGTPAASRSSASSPTTAGRCSSSATTSTPRAATSRCSAASSRRPAQSEVQRHQQATDWSSDFVDAITGDRPRRQGCRGRRPQRLRVLRRGRSSSRGRRR